MKTASLLFALIAGCAVPSLAQVNRNHKMDTGATIPPFSYPNERKKQFRAYNFTDKYGRSFNDKPWSSYPLLTREMALLENAESSYSADHMPCFKPTGIYFMRIYEPDSTVNFTILHKKF